MTQPAGIEPAKHGAGIPAATARFSLRLPGVPIFNYHGLTERFAAGIPEAAQRFWLTPGQLGAHLAQVRQAGFRVVILEELKASGSDAAGKARMTAVTFDDGLASDYEIALPLLAKFGVRGIFFVNPSTVGQAGYLTWSQLAEMRRAGMSIQSHSHHHLDLRVLPAAVLERELIDSKRCLEDRLAAPVEFLAAPHGLLSRRVVRAALASGYRGVCSTRCWPANPRAQVLTRITLHRDITPEGFHAFLTGRVSAYALRLGRGLLYRPWTMAGHAVGILRYRWLRKAVPVSQ